MIVKDGSDFCCLPVIRDYEGNYIPLVVSLNNEHAYRGSRAMQM